MTTCRRCGTQSPRIYCSPCEDKVYELKRDWDGTIHELTDELDKAMRTAFQELEHMADAPTSLELLETAWYEHNLEHYRCQLGQIYEELIHADPDEFPTEEELREQAGCDRYHALKDEGLLR